MSKHRLFMIIALILLVITGVCLLWPNYLATYHVTPEVLYEFSSGCDYRKEDGTKVESSMYTWFSYFNNQFGTPIAQQVFSAYSQEHELDFEHYTYILSFGFTIKELQYGGTNALKKMRAARVIHGLDCEPNAVLLYRIPKVYIEPYSNRESSYYYEFRE